MKSLVLLFALVSAYAVAVSNPPSAEILNPAEQAASVQPYSEAEIEQMDRDIRQVIRSGDTPAHCILVDQLVAIVLEEQPPHGQSYINPIKNREVAVDVLTRHRESLFLAIRNLPDYHSAGGDIVVGRFNEVVDILIFSR